MEENLQSFPGAVLLVTHDRYLMDRVCNGMLGFMGEGVSMFYADYSQYAMGVAATRLEATQKAKAAAAVSASFAAKPRPTKKLSYNDQRDLDTIESRIQIAEQKLAAATDKASLRQQGESLFKKQ